MDGGVFVCACFFFHATSAIQHCGFVVRALLCVCVCICSFLLVRKGGSGRLRSLPVYTMYAYTMGSAIPCILVLYIYSNG